MNYCLVLKTSRFGRDRRMRVTGKGGGIGFTFETEGLLGYRDIGREFTLNTKKVSVQGTLSKRECEVSTKVWHKKGREILGVGEIPYKIVYHRVGDRNVVRGRGEDQ